MIFAGIVVAAAVVGTSAQGLTSVSASCQAAAANVLTGPAATCLGVSGLVNIAMTPANQSIVTPVNNWLTTVCAQPACEDAVLEAAVTNITTGCSTEFNITTSEIPDITAFFKEWYPTGRQVACLQDTNASDAFCVTTTLQAIEAYIGRPLSLNTLSNITTELAATSTEIPTSLICTSCIQAGYALIRPKLNETERGTIDSVLGAQCGSSFTDGTSPASIKQSANTAAANSAMSLSSGIFGSAATLLVGVAGLAVLAL